MKVREALGGNFSKDRTASWAAAKTLTVLTLRSRLRAGTETESGSSGGFEVLAAARQ